MASDDVRLQVRPAYNASAALEVAAVDKQLRARLRSLFDRVDTDGSGTVSTSELAELCSTLNLDLTRRQVKKMLQEADEDNSGSLDFEEFVVAFTRQSRDSGTPNLGLVISSAAIGSRFVLHPQSVQRLLWDLISTIFLLYNLVLVPYRICFDQHAYCPGGMWLFEALVDWFFVADIFVNFATGYVSNNGLIIADLCSIAKNYAKTWLIIDVSSSVPVDFFMSLAIDGCTGASATLDGDDESNLKAVKMVRILRLVKLLKLLRLLKLSRLFDQLQDEMPVPMVMTALSKAAMLFVLTLYIGHFIGCLWFWVGVASRVDGYASWLDGIDSLAAVGSNATLSQGEVADAYVASLYWAFTTMTTVGCAYTGFQPAPLRNFYLSPPASLASADH